MSTLMVMLILITLFFLMTEEKKESENLKSSFECGFTVMNMKKNKYSTKFFLMTMMFLVFDIEISFLIPTLMMNKTNLTSSMSALIFITALTILFLKEWNHGLVEWK